MKSDVNLNAIRVVMRAMLMRITRMNDFSPETVAERLKEEGEAIGLDIAFAEQFLCDVAGTPKPTIEQINHAIEVIKDVYSGVIQQALCGAYHHNKQYKDVRDNFSSFLSAIERPAYDSRECIEAKCEIGADGVLMFKQLAPMYVFDTPQRWLAFLQMRSGVPVRSIVINRVSVSYKRIKEFLLSSDNKFKGQKGTAQIQAFENAGCPQAKWKRPKLGECNVNGIFGQEL